MNRVGAAARKGVISSHMQAGIILYEDKQELRESISQLILQFEGYALLASYGNATDVVNQVKALQPDLVLMDIEMPGGINGIEAVARIRRLYPVLPVIMLTVFDDNRHVLEAICQGASGYLLKKDLAGKLMDGIRDVLNGGAPMSPSIARMVLVSMREKAMEQVDPYHLTAGERKVLYALSLGNSYKMIAAQQIVSLDTVRSHIKNIYRKLQVHSQLEAVHKARSAGLL